MSESRPSIHPGESMTPRKARDSSEDHYTKYKKLYKEAAEADDKADTLSHLRAIRLLERRPYDSYEAMERQKQIDTISEELAGQAFKAYATKAELHHHVINYIPDEVSENRAAFHDAAVAEARLDGVIVNEEKPVSEETKPA